LVVRQCGVLLAAGLGIGLGVAALVVRPLSIFLIPDVRPGDPTNFLVVAGVLGLVSLAPIVAPAVRLRIEPTVAHGTNRTPEYKMDGAICGITPEVLKSRASLYLKKCSSTLCSSSAASRGVSY
jgi:hypothetical protein